MRTKLWTSAVPFEWGWRTSDWRWALLHRPFEVVNIAFNEQLVCTFHLDNLINWLMPLVKGISHLANPNTWLLFWLLCATSHVDWDCRCMIFPFRNAVFQTAGLECLKVAPLGRVKGLIWWISVKDLQHLISHGWLCISHFKVAFSCHPIRLPVWREFCERLALLRDLIVWCDCV